MREESQSFPPYPTETSGRDETVDVKVGVSGGNRVFELTTTAARRDNPSRQRRIEERPTDPHLLTGSPLFDALFAQAVDDARLNAVSSIRDGAYRHGEPIPCDCYQTGEKWTYVWTRDASYATHLGLAVLDPERAATTLLYKVSPFRDGLTLPEELPAGSLQIVQDTGSGGSWPVSTDRVSWAFGAEALLGTLHGDARAAFAETAYRALSGTIEADRLAVFDAADGLYRGEQSFLDWRDQTYAPWAIDDLTTIATSKALSTNVCHYKALDFLARLASERGDKAKADRYAGWAAELRVAIDRGFWLEGMGLYASITTPDSPARPVEKFDMLGLALAILTGVTGRDRARRILASYPHVPFGVPVYYPAQPDIFCYHKPGHLALRHRLRAAGRRRDAGRRSVRPRLRLAGSRRRAQSRQCREPGVADRSHLVRRWPAHFLGPPALVGRRLSRHGDDGDLRLSAGEGRLPPCPFPYGARPGSTWRRQGRAPSPWPSRPAPRPRAEPAAAGRCAGALRTQRTAPQRNAGVGRHLRFPAER